MNKSYPEFEWARRSVGQNADAKPESYGTSQVRAPSYPLLFISTIYIWLYVIDTLFSLDPSDQTKVYVDGQNKQKNSHRFIESIYFNVGLYPFTSKFSFGAYENSSVLIIQRY